MWSSRRPTCSRASVWRLHIPVGPMPAGFALLNVQCCLGFHSGLVDALFLVSYR